MPGLETLILENKHIADRLIYFYVGKFPRHKEDIIGVGQLALVEAVNRKPDHENIGGYVYMYVKGMILNFVTQNENINAKRSTKIKKEIDEGINIREKYGIIAVPQVEVPQEKQSELDIEFILESKVFTKQERTILRLKYEGFSDDAIGIVLGLRKAWVGRVRNRCKERIKYLLGEESDIWE